MRVCQKVESNYALTSVDLKLWIQNFVFFRQEGEIQGEAKSAQNGDGFLRVTSLVAHVVTGEDCDQKPGSIDEKHNATKQAVVF